MTRRRHRAGCVSGKVRFRSKDEALRALRSLAKTSTREKVPQRVYECQRCSSGWHLTSQEAR